jgi:hypothetical protein
MSVSLAVWAMIFFIYATKIIVFGSLKSRYIDVSIRCWLTILCLFIAEVIFYAIAFARNRKKKAES